MAKDTNHPDRSERRDQIVSDLRAMILGDVGCHAWDAGHPSVPFEQAYRIAGIIDGLHEDVERLMARVDELESTVNYGRGDD